MADIVFDAVQGSFVASLSYGTRRITVKLKPDMHDWFVETSVTDAHGVEIKSDQRHKYSTDAKSELKQWFIDRLKPQKDRVVVSGLSERIEIAFWHKLFNMTPDQRHMIAPLDQANLALLMTMGRDIVNEHVRLSAEGSVTGHDAPNWYELKTSILKQRRKESCWSEPLRDFYSSVLGTALSWKKNYVPRPVYEQVMNIKPGVDLVFSLK